MINSPETKRQFFPPDFEFKASIEKYPSNLLPASIVSEDPVSAKYSLLSSAATNLINREKVAILFRVRSYWFCCMRVDVVEDLYD